jgi:hypothetical protein
MKLIPFLPYENYMLLTNLSPEEVGRRISANIEPRLTGVFSEFTRNNTKPYQGVCARNKFEISRIINYRNSFIPVISGEVSSYLGVESRIHIKMKPHSFVIVFMCIWLGFGGLFCLLILSNMFRPEMRPDKELSIGEVIPFVMFIGGCLLFSLPFKFESKKSKLFLAELLEGHEI